MLKVLDGLLIGLKVHVALEAAGLLNVVVSSNIEYGSEAIPPDHSLVKFDKLWLYKFIQRLDQQDLNKWRKP
jgi:hypothetical protein